MARSDEGTRSPSNSAVVQGSTVVRRGTDRRRQVNLWLTDDDLAFLRELAREREQSVSGLLRRAIAVWRQARTPPADRDPTTVVRRVDTARPLQDTRSRRRART